MIYIDNEIMMEILDAIDQVIDSRLVNHFLADEQGLTEVAAAVETILEESS